MVSLKREGIAKWRGLTSQGPLYNHVLYISPEEDQSEQGSQTWYSLFPIENEELVYGKWEDNIIWDAQVRACIAATCIYQF